MAAKKNDEIFWAQRGHEMSTKQNANPKVGVLLTADTASLLVARVGFEPTTFGL